MPTQVSLIKLEAIEAISDDLAAEVAASATAAATSETNAATSATASANSASSAATSAATAALIAAGLNFKGTVAGGSVAATSTNSGDFHIISSAGTSQGITWAQDDFAIYKGTSGQWTQLSGRVIAQASYNGQMSSRQGADYLQSDGATTNRRIETQYGAVGAVAGSELTEVDYVFDVPTSNPTNNAILFYWGTTTAPNGNTAHADYTNALVALLGTDGHFYVIQRGATPATDYRILQYTGWRAAFSGRRVRMTFAFTGNSTTAPVIWQDAVDITSSFTASSSGTANWVNTSMPSTYHLRGYNWPSGYFRPGRPVNRKYAQADVDFVQLTGRLPFADAVGGSAVSLVTGNDSNFDSDTGFWGKSGGATINNASDGVLTLPANALVSRSGLFLAGRRYRYSITLSSNGGSVLVYNGTNGQATISGTGTFTGEITTGNAGGLLYILAAGSNTGNSVVTEFLWYQVGALSDPIIQPCLVLDDATQNNRASILVGFSPVTSRKDWRIPAWVDMSSTGNKQLLAGAVFSDPTKQAIDTIEDTCAGTPTFSIGDGTTAAKYVASSAHSAGRLRETLAANFPADSAKTGIYANVGPSSASSTAELIVVRGHRE